MVRDALEDLVVGSTQIVPKDWESWIAAIEEKPDWAQALDVAQSACSEWAVDLYRNDPGRIRRLAERLHALTPAVLETVRYALPHLTRFFLDEGGSNFVFEPIYRSILLLLAVDSKFGSEDWLLTQNLTTAVFDAGPGAEAYTDVVEALTAVWQSRGEVARLDWALDQLDTLVLVPAVVPAKRYIREESQSRILISFGCCVRIWGGVTSLLPCLRLLSRNQGGRCKRFRHWMARLSASIP
jgi:hypothetical protein